MRPVCGLARQPTGPSRAEVDREGEAAGDVGGAADQPLAGVQLAQRGSSRPPWPRRKRIWLSRMPGRTSTEKERGEISA